MSKPKAKKAKAEKSPKSTSLDTDVEAQMSVVAMNVSEIMATSGDKATAITAYIMKLLNEKK